MTGKKALLHFIQAFHVLICIFALIAPFITNDAFYLSLFIVYYIGGVTLWHIFGNCFITDIEHRLEGKKNPKSSYISDLAANILGSHTKIVFSLVPLINTIVCLYKINV
jgi:hypothetical protein